MAEVIAAIPNYNMAARLGGLLEEVASQDYCGVYVLDDASTDGSRDVVASFGGEVTWVDGEQNIGSGGNRNRILKALDREKRDPIIHFLDADVRLETPDAPEVIAEVMADETTATVGGLVKHASGRQHEYNFGPRLSLWGDLTAALQTVTHGSPAWRARFSRILRDWPDPNVQPEPRQVFWMLESNMAIRAEALRRAGGFDDAFRDHDIQALTLRMKRAGVWGRRRFEPQLVVTHYDDINVRGGNRGLSMLKAETRMIHQYGIRNYLLPGGRLRPRQ